jgi:[citrate (pro-3S)-lyase] ligase
MEEIRKRILGPQDEDDYARVGRFLADQGLRLERDLDRTFVYLKDDSIVATGSRAKNVIKDVAVADTLRGTGFLQTVVSDLLHDMTSEGIGHAFVFTPPPNASLFVALGFSQVAAVEGKAALLEWGKPDLHDYIRYLKEHAVSVEPTKAASIVMNANPFTNGHRYLVEAAASRFQHVYVIAVETDLSLFPFRVRFELITKGTVDLPNVTVLRGGEYTISPATFPSYFTREEEFARVQQELDLTVFSTRIAEALGVANRVVGDEPYCPVTRAYNDTMSRVLPRFGIELHIIKRKSTDAGAISASKVREAIRTNKMQILEKLVPKSTLDYLKSDEAVPIIERIRTSTTRH